MANQQQSTQKKQQSSAAKKPTNVGEWRSKRGEAIELPSGNVALVAKPDLRKFLHGGDVPDSLTALVKAQISGDQNKIEKEQAKMGEYDGMLEDYFTYMDYIVTQTVIEPVVLQVPTREDEDGNIEDVPYDERDLEAGLYADEVDFDDKMFLFDFAIRGTKDLESFRVEQAQLMGSSPNGEGVSDETE